MNGTGLRRPKHRRLANDVEQTRFRHECNRLLPVQGSHFCSRAIDVVPHSALNNVQLQRNVISCQTPRDKSQDFELCPLVRRRAAGTVFLRQRNFA